MKPATGVAKNNCSYRCLYSHYSEYKYPLFSLSKRHLCHLYIRKKYTDTETVIEQMKHTVSQFDPTDITVEKELSSIFKPLENLQ